MTISGQEALRNLSSLNISSTSEECVRDADNNLAAIIAYEVAIGLICLFSVTGNALVLYVIVKTPELVTPINYFIFSLALSDMLQASSVMPYTFAHHYTAFADFFGIWHRCCFLLAIVTASQLASAFNLVGLLVARYFTIKYPLGQHSKVTHGKVACGTVAAWLLSFALACGLHVRTKPESFCGVCRSELFWGLYEVVGMMVFTETVPSLIMFITFYLTTRAYAKHVKELTTLMQTNASQNDNTRQDIRIERRLSRMTFFLIMWFFISYLPFMIFTFVYRLCKDCYISNYVRFFSRLMYISNIAVNFVAYIIGHDKFRHAVCNILCHDRERRRKASLATSSSQPQMANASSTNTLADSAL